MNGTYSKTERFRDIAIGVCALALAVVFLLSHFFPKPAPTPVAAPDRIEATAEAFLELQPATLERAAQALDAGLLKPDGVAQFIQDAHKGPSADFATALKDSGPSSTALRRAAAAQRKRMR